MKSSTSELGLHAYKNYHLFKVVENRMPECCATHIVHSCQQHCSALLSLNQPPSGETMLNNIVDNYEQYGSTTLLHPVFNNLEEVLFFCHVGG